MWFVNWYFGVTVTGVQVQALTRQQVQALTRQVCQALEQEPFCNRS